MKEDYSIRLNLPYLEGVMLAVNAIPDAYLVVDASDCIMAVSDFHKNHDLNSTLLDPGGQHRIFHTNANINRAATDRSESIKATLRRLIEKGNARTIFLTATPMTNITGYQYDKIIRAMDLPGDIRVIEVQRRGLRGDWLDGYANTLEAISRNVGISSDNPNPQNAVIIGYMMDRSEEDHKGNIRELKRTLENGVGLNLVSIWLEDQPFDMISSLENIGTVISMPYAREAARTMAEKAGATLLETGLPMGLAGTSEWLLQIARRLGREDRARSFIDEEFRNHIPKLEWTIPKWFVGKHVVFCGDPHMVSPVKKLVEEVGCSFRCEMVVSHAGRISKDDDIISITACEKRAQQLRRSVVTNEKHKKTDLYIANSLVAEEIRAGLGHEIPLLEFGFPSYNFHALYDTPFLGFRGAMSFYNRMANFMNVKH